MFPGVRSRWTTPPWWATSAARASVWTSAAADLAEDLVAGHGRRQAGAGGSPFGEGGGRPAQVQQVVHLTQAGHQVAKRRPQVGVVGAQLRDGEHLALLLPLLRPQEQLD